MTASIESIEMTGASGGRAFRDALLTGTGTPTSSSALIQGNAPIGFNNM